MTAASLRKDLRSLLSGRGADPDFSGTILEGDLKLSRQLDEVTLSDDTMVLSFLFVSSPVGLVLDRIGPKATWVDVAIWRYDTAPDEEGLLFLLERAVRAKFPMDVRLGDGTLSATEHVVREVMES